MGAFRLLTAVILGPHQEFTAATPGSQDRGAQRITAGKNGER
jgi:guanyl-specific ribonuclease Sa